MSALSVIWHADGAPVDATALERVVRTGAHRGPDATRTWLQGPIGLGYSSLVTTDEAVDDGQPIWRPDLGLAVVADARVDNRAEIETAARDRGLRAIGASDAERILLAYAVWGDACASRLLGDFAFAVADVRQRRLFLARDYIGMRQLHYWTNGRRVVAATEPRQVAAHADVGRSVNWAHLGDQLCLNWRNLTDTLYAGVQRLPAGHTLAVDGDGPRRHRYWRPEDIAEEPRMSPVDEAARFAELLTEAVRCRLRARGPVLISLSGGLDSSSISCVAAKLAARDVAATPVRTFSLVYPGRPEDERPYIDAVVGATGLRAVFVPYDDAASGEAAAPDRAADFPDVPYEPGHFAQAAIAARAIRAEGARVVLEGIGGDELFIQHSVRVADALRDGRWRSARQAVRQVAAIQGRRRWYVWRDEGLRPLIPESARRFSRRALHRLGAHHYSSVTPWVDHEFARKYQLDARAEDARRSQKSPRSAAFAAYCDLLTRGYNMTVGLTGIDSMDTALGIESRQPFLDRRLVEFSLGLADEARVPDGRTKELLRRAMGEMLPGLVRDRTSKANFAGLRNEFLDRHGAAVSTLIESPELERAGVVKRGGPRALLARCLQGDAASMPALLCVVKLELWYRAFGGDAVTRSGMQ